MLQQQPSGKAQDKELITYLTDAIALSFQCHHNINSTRCQAMKKDLQKEYAALCSAATVPVTSEYLFGDLLKLTKDISEANKLTKKVRPPQRNTARNGKSGLNGRRYSYTNHGTQGNRRFHPYQRTRSDFFSKGRPPRTRLRSLRSDDGERVRRQTWSRRGGERSPLQWREKSLKIRAGPGRRVIEEAFLIYLLRSL